MIKVFEFYHNKMDINNLSQICLEQIMNLSDKARVQPPTNSNTNAALELLENLQ